MTDVPNILLKSPWFTFNLTVWASIFSTVFTIAIATMATIIKIYKKAPNPEELPGKSTYCKQEAKEILRIQKASEINQQHICELKSEIATLTTKIAVLAAKLEGSTNELEEIKTRLNDLLKQLMDYANS